MLFSGIHGNFKYCPSFAIYNNPYVDSFSLEDIRLKQGVSSHKPSRLNRFGLTDDRNA